MCGLKEKRKKKKVHLILLIGKLRVSNIIIGQHFILRLNLPTVEDTLIWQARILGVCWGRARPGVQGAPKKRKGKKRERKKEKEKRKKKRKRKGKRKEERGERKIK